MSAVFVFCALMLAQTGGSSPAMSGFWYGAGRVVAILLAVLVGGVLLALFRARGRGR